MKLSLWWPLPHDNKLHNIQMRIFVARRAASERKEEKHAHTPKNANSLRHVSFEYSLSHPGTEFNFNNIHFDESCRYCEIFEILYNRTDGMSTIHSNYTCQQTHKALRTVWNLIRMQYNFQGEFIHCSKYYVHCEYTSACVCVCR